MRRLVSLTVLLFFAIPFGLSVTGCKKVMPVQYCSSGDSGPVVGQVASISLSPTLAVIGESLNYAQVGQALSATATDCLGNSVSVKAYTFATTDMSFADINPSTGQVCGGTWNRQTGGGIADYTTCSAPAATPKNYLAYVTATAEGATSNAIPVYVHPTVTSVVIGTPSTTAQCTAGVDVSNNCCPTSTTAPVTATPYSPLACQSQGTTSQLTARVYANGTTNAADNITCQVGRLSFAAQNATNIVTIDQNGVATANQPGSATVTATISSSASGSTAGFFSTCPPAAITLSVPGQPTGTSSITETLNNTQPLTAVVTDTNGVTLTGLSLEFNSTTPQIIPGSSSVVPAFPGTATITAVCQPGSCNPAPYSQIGYLGNGKPITSNGITVTAVGTSSTVIYAGSTSSQYLYPVDFTTSQPPSLVKLPYVPNSMVITQDGTAIYLGSSQALMTVSATTNAVTATNVAVTGPVLSVSPDGTTLVVTDPSRGTTSLVTNSGSISATYGAVATRAQWAPDSQTVYITTTGSQLLTHSAFTGWSAVTTDEVYRDVAVTVPSVGAYFAGALTEGRSYCASSAVGTTGTPPAVVNSFDPLADENAAQTDRLAATTDGKHVLGATAATGVPTLNDLTVTLPTQVVAGVTTISPCPTVVPTNYFKSVASAHPLTGVTASAINAVVPATNSTVAFVTYTGTSGLLPLYVPGTGTLSFVTLSGGAASAPVSGVFSTDNSTFYVGTSGDNKIHLVTVKGTSATDSSTLTPNLPDVNGNIVAPNLLVQRPKKSTS